MSIHVKMMFFIDLMDGLGCPSEQGCSLVRDVLNGLIFGHLGSQYPYGFLVPNCATLSFAPLLSDGCYWRDVADSVIIDFYLGNGTPMTWEPEPDLAAFMARFDGLFRRSEGRKALLHYTAGLLTDLPEKTAQGVAQGIPEADSQRLQGFLTTAKWDERALNEQRVAWLLSELDPTPCILEIGEVGFPKRGPRSVGVARQRIGADGKVENCQVAVAAVCAGGGTAWPLDARLYLPEDWANDNNRRTRVGIPEDVDYRTRQEIALEMVDVVQTLGVDCVVTGDLDFVCTGDFLEGIKRRGVPYLLVIPPESQVEGGLVPRQVDRVDETLDRVPLSDYKEVTWRDERSRERKKTLIPLRGRVVQEDWRSPVGWLVGEPGSAPKREIKRYLLTNLPIDDQLGQIIDTAGSRSGLTDFINSAADELGWGDYQGRLWTGFHRHTAIVMLAYSFLKWIERPQRRELPRPRTKRRRYGL